MVLLETVRNSGIGRTDPPRTCLLFISLGVQVQCSCLWLAEFVGNDTRMIYGAPISVFAPNASSTCLRGRPQSSPDMDVVASRTPHVRGAPLQSAGGQPQSLASPACPLVPQRPPSPYSHSHYWRCVCCRCPAQPPYIERSPERP